MSEGLPPMPPVQEYSDDSAIVPQGPLPAPVQRTPKTPVRLGSPLTDLDAAWRLAMNMAGARNMNKDIRGNAADIFLVFMIGAELQIGPAQSLANIAVFDGLHVLRGQLVAALTRRAGHMIEEIESDDKHALLRLTRGDNGQVSEAEFTIEDAKRAKLVFEREDGTLVSQSKNGYAKPWQLYTPDMLYWRALGRLVRRGCSEVTLGGYIEGEIEQPEEPLANQAMAAMSVAEPSQEDILAEVKAIENTSVPLDPQWLSEEEILESETVE